MENIHIPAKSILENFSYRFSSVRDVSALKRSIEETGMRNPLDVIPKQKGYILLSGFSRYEAAMQMEKESLPCVIHASNTDRIRVFHNILLEHSISHTLNLAEKSRVLLILEGMSASWDRLREGFLPILELPPQQSIVNKVKNVSNFAPGVLRYIEWIDLSLKQTEVFEVLDEEAQDFFASMGLRLQIRGVELADIIQMMRDIVGRDGRDMMDVISELKINPLLEDDELNRNEKVKTLKERIRGARYPQITEWNTRLEALRKQIPLPGAMQMSWDPSLEKMGVKATLHLASPDDVDALASVFFDKKNQETIKTMLELV